MPKAKAVSTYQEHPNREALDWLLHNPTFLAQAVQDHTKNNPESTRYNHTDLPAALRQYAQNLKKNGVKVTYKHARGQSAGRRYAQGPSMQSFPKIVREMLQHGSATDLDFANAAPGFLHQLCVKQGIAAPKLAEYAIGRDQIQQNSGLSLSTVKRAALRLLFGGSLEDKVKQAPWWMGFATECRATLKTLCNQNPELYAQKKRSKSGHGKSPEGAVAATLVFCIEDRCLQALEAHLSTNNFKVQTLSFDGLQIRKSKHLPDFAAAQAHILQQTGYSVQLVEKPIPLHQQGEPPAPSPAPAPQYLERDLLLSLTQEHDLVSVRSAMGTGKTETLIPFLQHAQQENLKVLMVCGRIAAVADVHKRCTDKGLQFVSYSTVPPGPIDSASYPNVIVCYESTVRIRGHYDVIIYDEQRCLTASAVSATNGHNMGSNWQKHLDLTAHAQHVVFLDAHLTVDGAAYAAQDLILSNRCKFRAARLLELAGTVPPVEAALMTAEAALMQQGIGYSVHRVESELINIRRSLVYASEGEFLAQIQSDLDDGLRIGVVVGSIRGATLLRDMFEEEGVNVGLYTGKTDNHEAFLNITESWDKHQMIIFTSTLTTGADYGTEIDRVFVWPAVNTCTPRDMHQMVGRFRNVKSSEVWVRTHGGRSKPPVIRKLTRAEIDKRYKSEFASLVAAQTTNALGHQAAVQKLKFTVGPKVYIYQYIPAVHDLLFLKAHLQAEMSYTANMNDWLSYYAYMAELQGYTTIPVPHIPTSDCKELTKLYKGVKEARKEAEEETFETVDVSQLMDKASLDNLAKFARRDLFTGHKQFQEQVEESIGQPLTRDLAEQMVIKVRCMHMFSEQEALPEYSQAKNIVRERHALCNYAVMREMSNGNDVYMIQCHADLLLSNSKHPGAELHSAHAVYRMLVGQELAKGLGFESIQDTETVITEDAFTAEAVKAALVEASNLGFGGAEKQTITAAWISAVLGASIACTLLHDKEEDTYTLSPKLPAYEDLYGAASLLDEEWFKNRYGFTLPALDANLPQLTDDSERLSKLSEMYKGCDRHEFQQVYERVNRLLKSAKARENNGWFRRGIANNSRKRECNWNSMQPEPEERYKRQRLITAQ